MRGNKMAKEPKLQKLTKIAGTKFVQLYKGIFKLPNGNTKEYDIVSRKEITDIKNVEPAAVTMFATNQAGDKMLIVKEFRYPVNKEVIDTPSGLIDPGEDPVTAALRELHEETGYTDAEVVEVLPASYSTIGLTNESVVPVILRVNENVNEGQCTEDSEKIEPYWVTREEAAEILKSSDIAARAQLAIRMFVKGCL